MGEVNKSLTHIGGIGHPNAADLLTPIQKPSNQLLAAFSYTSKTLRCLLRIEPVGFPRHPLRITLKKR